MANAFKTGDSKAVERIKKRLEVRCSELQNELRRRVWDISLTPVIKITSNTTRYARRSPTRRRRVPSTRGRVKLG